MDFGVMVPQGWRLDLVGISDPSEAYETMTAVAQEADALGYHSIWLYDHFHTVPTSTQEITFECWTSITALARDTGGCASVRWSRAVAIAILLCWPKWPVPSMRSVMDDSVLA